MEITITQLQKFKDVVDKGEVVMYEMDKIIEATGFDRETIEHIMKNYTELVKEKLGIILKV